MMEIIDAYAHCGLSKYEPIENVREVMKTAGVSGAVLVQHLGEFDNSYIGDIAASDPTRFAGVCLVDSSSVTAVEDLKKEASSGAFKGIRFTIDVFKNSPQLCQAAVDEGLIIVLFAPDGIAEHVEILDAFLNLNPSCRLVITHLGNPDLGDGPGFEAYKRVFTLARHAGVYYQVSGMKMFCPYPHRELYSLIGEAAESFGVSRLVWGSNYPVVGADEDYIKDLHLLLGGKLPLPEQAVNEIAGNNAHRLWFSDPG